MNSSLCGRPLGNVTFPMCCRIVREGFYWPSRVWWRLLSLPFIQADLHIVSGSSHQLGRNPSTFLGTSSRRKIPEIVRTNHSKLKPSFPSLRLPLGILMWISMRPNWHVLSCSISSHRSPHPQAILGARSHFCLLLTTTSPPPSQTKTAPSETNSVIATKNT